jgi:hypothetical protein
MDNNNQNTEKEQPIETGIPLIVIDKLPKRVLVEFSVTSLAYFAKFAREYGRPDPASPNYEGEVTQSLIAWREMNYALSIPTIPSYQEQQEESEKDNKETKKEEEN